MGSEELAVNLFCIAQTKSRLKAIKEAGETMPEDLPTPKESF